MARSTKVNVTTVKDLLAIKLTAGMKYQIHMKQAQDAKRMFKGDKAMLKQIDEVIKKIKLTYIDDLAKEQADLTHE